MNKISPYHIAKSPVMEDRRISFHWGDLVKKEPDLTLAINSGDIRTIPTANSFHRTNKDVIIDSYVVLPYNGNQYIRKHVKVGRNDSCPCGSGIKFKRCCIDKHKNDWK